MKHYFFIMLTMAAAVIASCTKQTLVEEQPPVDSVAPTYIYTVSANTAETKSDYDASGKFQWSAGDAISVLFNNGTENKFFTLTLTEGAGTNTATFSGPIETGYTIGASDGAEVDQKIWALYPASENHTYTEGNNPTFYVQPSVDFSETHFSANIPMYALNSEEGNFSFTSLASTYKFTVNGIQNGVDKVQFKIYNQTTYALSGSWPIHNDMYIKYDYASPGSPNSTLTYISDVTNNQAVFYVSCRYWGEFQPAITVTNCDTGIDILTFTATKAQKPVYLDRVQPITLDVTNGNYFTPAVTIDGDFSDWADIEEWESTRGSGSTNSRINNWKMQADASNIYVYLNLVTSNIKNTSYFYVGFDTDSDSGTCGSHGGIGGLEQYVVVYPAVAESVPVAMIQGEADPRSQVNGHWDGSLMTWGNMGETNTLVEVCIPRSKVGLTESGSIKVSVAVDWYDTIQKEITLP